MRLCWKLSALGAVLVLSTAFASADTVVIASNFQTQFTGYNANPANSTPTNNPPTFTNNIAAGTTWTHELTNSNWISWDPNSGPTGGQTAGSCLPPGPAARSTRTVPTPMSSRSRRMAARSTAARSA